MIRGTTMDQAFGHRLDEREPGSGDQEETLNVDGATALEAATDNELEDETLCQLRSCVTFGHAAFVKEDDYQAEWLFTEGIVLATSMHFEDSRLENAKRLLWMDLHHRLSVLKLCQNKIIQSMEQMHKAMRLTEYTHVSVDMLRCIGTWKIWLGIAGNIQENKEALHNYVTKTCTIAEDWRRQGNHDAVGWETVSVIPVLEALWRAGDLAFATEDKLRHVYVMHGLAVCNKLQGVDVAECCRKKAFDYGGFDDPEAIRLALRVHKKKGDFQKALRYAQEGVKVSPEDDEFRKATDQLANCSIEQATPCSSYYGSKTRSSAPKQGRSGAVTRTKKKPKVKFYPRRGHEPEVQTTVEHEGLSTSRSGKGFTIGVSHATAATTIITAAKKTPASPSEKAFEIISKKYEIRLACVECATENDSVTDHECCEAMLLLKKKNESVSPADWVHVRPRPLSWNLSDGRCACTEPECRRQHNDYEGKLWKNNVDISAVVRDMRVCPPIRAMYIVSKLTMDQRYVFVCKTCFENNPDDPITKTPHRPVCKRGHPWENLVCLFEEVDNGAKTYSEPKIDDVTTTHNLVEECVRSKQRKICERNRPEHSETSTDNESDLSTCESSSLENSIDTNTVDNMSDEDILTRDDDQDDDTLEIIYQDGDVYYKMHVEHELDNLLSGKPDRYKRCTLRLTGRHSAICTPEVVEGNLSKIAIKGRTNCGPTFDGDDVVVEVIRTKELDKESSVLSGRVAGVFGGRVKRSSHIFVCNVDEYMSCLMVPRCGVAPKIHIIDSYLREKYDKIRNQLVTVYEKRDGCYQRKRIEPERLNPKDRQSKLFVVRYIKWATRFMYPLGCVVKVISPGRDLPTGQRILNLQYQVRQQFPADVVSYAESACAPDTLGGRCDLRGEYTFTIDPPGCKDIDDALSVRKLDRDGHDVYEVYVHIADVTHYVKLSDPVEIESRRRGTTFYPEVGCSAFHILPERLSEDLCSLLPGKDRLALSVLLTLDDDGNLLDPNPTVSRAIINNNVQLTYADVHETLSSNKQNKCNKVDEDLHRRLVWLHDLSQRRRQKRLQDARFYSQYGGLFEIDNHAVEAHELIEEFMLLANREVAKFLVAKFPDYTPVRRQKDPEDDDFRSWQTKYATVAQRTFYFESFNELLPVCDERENDDFFPLLTDTVRELREAVKAGDVARATTLVSSEQLHPEFARLFPSWYGIQEKSEYTRSINGTSCRHFTLREDVYTHFTSPIRRYFDTVVHRLVKAAIDGEPSPYTRDEIDQLCCHLNYKMTQQKRYDNDLKLLKIACSLNSAAQFLPGVVEDIGEGHFSVYLPHLRVRKDVKYGLLRVRKALLAERDSDSPPDKVTLHWSRKVFDTRGCPTHARATCAVKESLRLATDVHVVRVPRDQWKDVRRAIIASTTESLLPALSSMLSDARSSSNELTPEVTSEMRMDEPLWRKACDFQLSLKRNDTLMFQVGAELVRGLLEPTVRLVNLTRQLDLCIEHTDQPVKCFAETAVLHSKKEYRDIEEYQKIWLPMLAMESAECAVKEGDPTVVHNVNVAIRRTDNKLFGSFTLPKEFCKTRQIALIENMKKDEVATDNYLCIRCDAFPEPGAWHQSRNVWVGHALTQNACVVNEDDDDDDGGEIKVEFRVQNSTTDPPPAMLQNEFGVSCTMELMPKLNTDKRKEDAVRVLQEATELCTAIVLAKPVSKSDPVLERLCPEKLQVDTVRSSSLRYLPQSNDSQLRAIRAGLTGNFTVIQGPPGTGKTLTAVKLAYWFVQMNRKRVSGSDGTTRRQVLYCGPSNGAVDVAAKQLHDCFGKNAPKILRIYSEELERQVYPIPREAPVRIGHGRRFELIGSEDQKKIALHYLIRKPGNEFSARIAKYDQLFRKNMERHYNVDDKEIEKYTKLITDAAIHEIRQYDILLCTCSHSAGPRITRAANVTQCIVDECGMCTEPESLIPLTSHKPQQVVLIGDHKQLRPIVKQPTAKELGLEISLFERYEKKAILLDMQYRMHPAICEFPSQRFYGGWLKTADGFKERLNFDDYQKRRKGRLQAIWPNQQRPLVFCHVEGAEQSLMISSSDGNEASKSNVAERDHAVRIFAHLVNYCEVPQNKVTVLSQYRAQCSEITRNLEGVYGFERPNVSTVIASQGDEWDYVIMSTVRSMPQHEIDKHPTFGWLKVNLGFVMDDNQINVGLTRAKKGLIIIGNQHVLRCSAMWRALLDEYEANGCLVDISAFPRLAPVLNEGRRMRQNIR